MDDLVFEEFRGTGNSEILLDRSLAEARAFPAINLPGDAPRAARAPGKKIPHAVPRPTPNPPHCRAVAPCARGIVRGARATGAGMAPACLFA